MLHSVKKRWAGLVYVLPALFILGLFQIVPVIYAVGLSFTDWNFIRPQANFVGLQQYKTLMQDANFRIAVKNTIVYTAATVVCSGVLGLLLALAVNRQGRGVGLYRTLIFLPVITATSTAAIVWKWLYAPNTNGLINKLIGFIGMEPQHWLMDPKLALPAVIAMSIWQSTGYSMVIFLAGLQGISPAVVEAAKVDGAGRRHLLRYITLPLLAPTVLFVSIVTVIHSFQAMSQVYILTEGGPLKRTLVVVYYLYEQAFPSSNMAYGAAMAVVLFVIIAMFTLLQWRFAEKRVHYGD